MVIDIPDWYCTDSARGEGWGSRGSECPGCGQYMFDGTESVTEEAWRDHLAECPGREEEEAVPVPALVEMVRKAREGQPQPTPFRLPLEAGGAVELALYVGTWLLTIEDKAGNAEGQIVLSERDALALSQGR